VNIAEVLIISGILSAVAYILGVYTGFKTGAGAGFHTAQIAVTALKVFADQTEALSDAIDAGDSETIADKQSIVKHNLLALKRVIQ
jgi:uncharacterized membrane protein